MPDIYVTADLPEPLLNPLEGFDVGVWRGPAPVPRDVLMAEVQGASGILTMLTDCVDEGVLEAGPGLKVVSQMAVGVDNVDVAACRARGIAVGHTPGVLTETVADTAFALLGSIVRRLPEAANVVKSGEWGPWRPFAHTGRDLNGTVLGIVGMGRIGSAVARRAQGYEMDVIYTSTHDVDVPYPRVSLEQLLANADHVVLAASLTSQTEGMIGGPELALMKSTAYLVNVARGPLIDTGALVHSLATGEIAGVALDVTDPEPLPADHPLLTFPNCLVVPHIGSASVRTRTAMAELAVHNVLAGVTGQTLPGAYPVGD